MDDFVYQVDPSDVRMITPLLGKGWIVFTSPGKCSLAENGTEFPLLAADEKGLLVCADIAIICNECDAESCLFTLQEKENGDA